MVRERFADVAHEHRVGPSELCVAAPTGRLARNGPRPRRTLLLIHLCVPPPPEMMRCMAGDSPNDLYVRMEPPRATRPYSPSREICRPASDASNWTPVDRLEEASPAGTRTLRSGHPRRVAVVGVMSRRMGGRGTSICSDLPPLNGHHGSREAWSASLLGGYGPGGR